MTVYFHNGMCRLFEYAVKDMRKNEVALWWVHRKKDISRLTKSEVEQQIDMYNKGGFHCVETHTCEYKIDGRMRKFKLMCFNPKADSNEEFAEKWEKYGAGFDPVALHVFGVMIDAFVMIFPLN